jgi:CubicO group peptidase (beta-lactamase class C family)
MPCLLALSLGSDSSRSFTRKASQLLGASALCLAGMAAHAQTPISGQAVPSLSQLDTIMQTYMTQYSSPGASLAVTVDGRLVFARGYGYAKVDAGEFVQPDSLFRIASNSKPITAAGIYKLIEQGKLSLNTQPFATILSGLTPPSGTTEDPRYNNITIQELLQHTAGFDDSIPPYDPAFVFPVTAATAFGAPAPATPQLLIKYMLSQTLQHDPGTTYAYSNMGYIILGYVIEQVSGVPYATYIQNNIFNTAGIVRTQPGASLLAGRLPNEVSYYDYPGAPLASSVEPPVGSAVPFPYGGYSCTLNLANGCWVSSTLDLIRFTDSINGQFATNIFNSPPSSNPFRSPQFYFAVPPTGPGWEYVFYGSLPGTNSLVHLITNTTTTGKVTYSAIFNTRDGKSIEQPESDADNAIDAFVRTVTTWPSGDLFTNYKGTASSCSFTLGAPSQSAAMGGASLTVSLTDANYCAWSAVSNATWIHVTSGALNSDSGSVGYTVDANSGAARTGVIAIAGQNFTVTQNGTTTATTLVVGSSASTINVGQSVTLTATLSPSGSGSTNGEAVTFSSGITALGSANLTAGVATLTTSSLPAGTDSVTASYPGDTTFSTSASAGVQIVVNKATTALAVSATPTTANTGQSVTLTATLSPFSGGSTNTNGESVTFLNGTATLGTATLTGGVATLTTTALPAGTNSITASYAGDTNFTTSSAAAVQVVVSAAGKTTTALVLAAAPTGSNYGQAVTLTATLSPSTFGSNSTNGGTVTFASGGTSLGTGTLAGGIATLSTSALPAGTDALTAVYAGDTNFTTANSSLSITVAKAAATVTLGGLAATYSGSAHAATVTTTPASLSVGFTYSGSSTAPTAAGSYPVVATISDPNYTGTASGTLVIAKAAASVTLSGLSVTFDGLTHSATATTAPSGLTVTFTYNGSATAPSASGSYAVVATIVDANYTGTATGTLVIAVVLAPSSTALTSSASSINAGASATFTATVKGTGGTPTGTVTFLNGSTSLGTGTLTAGVATLTVSLATAGVDSVTAQYGGDSTFSGSTSSALLETVVPVGVSATISPTPLIIKSGSSGTLNIILTPTGGYTGTVSFSCGALPSNASCTFVPTSIAITAGTTTATDTLTIRTTTDTVAALTPALHPSGPLNEILSAISLWLPGSLLAMFGFKRGKRSPRLRRLLLLGFTCLAGLGIGVLTGCGTSADLSTSTPAGSYTVPVILTVSGGTGQTVNATVIVQ